MMIIHATYVVKWRMQTDDTSATHEHEVSMRVSQPSLEDFFRVLIFNGVRAFECTKEEA